MAVTNNKKITFTIENLAKSSRTENHDGDTNEMYFINRNPWQSVTSVHTSPYITKNEPSLSCNSPVQFHSPIGNMRDTFRLSPDDGYSSLNSTPASGSCDKLKRNVTKHENTPSVTGKSVKRKRIDVDVDENIQSRATKQVHNESVINSSFESVCLTSDCDEGFGETPRQKKARTAFSNEQIEALERRYVTQKYLPAGERSKLAREQKLTDQQVKTWFQNRRMKEKRKRKDESFPGSMPLPTGGVDISQLQALGIPCPPPYTISNKHQQMMRDDDIPSSPLSTISPQSPMFPAGQHVPFYTRFQPMTTSYNSLSGFASPNNQISGYR
ncbi:homeobox protein Hox-D3-like [Ylistrum balloti]|uniref:homeobox protein Hox-D3-like n=1 Tax=Ylistrum balloti TaxID=509963 RepID=UPI002905A0A7|nr:homeobox protein Hox-D3-like [Ylistrum balloti]